MKADCSLSPFDATVADLVAAARVAEASGFDAVWTYDHLSGISGGADAVLDPWVALTAIAAGTDRIRLGPLVLNAVVRHPAHVAVAAATLQDASGGRLLLGMGAGAGPGPYAAELEMVGLPVLDAATRRRRTEEAIGTVRALWRGAPSADGSRHARSGTAGFLRPDPEPPIVVGANGPRMAALAGRVADGVNVHWFEPDLEGLARVAREAAGRPDFAFTVEAPMEQEWLDGPDRHRLEAIGTDRVIYRWHAGMGTAAIAETGRRLAG